MSVSLQNVQDGMKRLSSSLAVLGSDIRNLRASHHRLLGALEILLEDPDDEAVQVVARNAIAKAPKP